MRGDERGAGLGYFFVTSLSINIQIYIVFENITKTNVKCEI